MNTLRRYYETLRWLRPRQVRARVGLRLRRATDPLCFPRRLARAIRREGAPPDFAPHVRDGRLGGVAARPALDPEAILAGEFRYANVTRRFPDAPDWLCPDPAQRFWYYNLHYFEYGPALAHAWRDTGNRAYLERLEALLRSWIDANPFGPTFAWDGGPLSHRIIYWCHTAFVLSGEFSDRAIARAFKDSLYAQALYLEDHLEYHLGGNHLLANGVALLHAGATFVGRAAARWRDRGLRILLEELEEQILDDGGHYERSPMYHAIVLDQCLRAMRLVRAAEIPEPPLLRHKIVAMAHFLGNVRAPDGGIPLLNDAAFGIARPPAALLEEAAALLDAPELRDAPAGIVALPDTGFCVARPQPDDFLVFDAGPVGPDYNPGHAHSDTLSFELSLGGRRVVVDSGTFSYAADPWREYCQSTRAHNTVMIDGVEQTEKWGPWHFRVARRAKPADVDWYEHEGLVVFQGSHTGYDHLPGGPRHVRRVLLIEARHWVVYDEVWGAGDHVAESLLHFHPEVTLTDDGASWRADASGHDLRVLFFGDGAVERLPATESPPQGWYCPEFGLRLPQAVLRATARGQLPLRFGWALLPGVQEAEIAIETSQKYIALRCRFDDATYLLRQTRGGRFHRAP